MSHKYFDYVRNVPDLNHFQSYVLHMLADHANPEGLAHPGVKLLAKETRLSERQVHYVLRQLEQKQLIAKIQGNKETRFRTVYRMTFADVFLITEKEKPAVTVPPSNGHRPPPRETAAYLPPLEPSPLPPEKIEQRRAMMREQLAIIAEKKRMETIERHRPTRAYRQPDEAPPL